MFVKHKTNQNVFVTAEDQSECVVIKQAINQDCTTVANDHHNETRQCEGLEAGVWFLDATVGMCGHCFTTLPSAS